MGYAVDETEEPVETGNHENLKFYKKGETLREIHHRIEKHRHEALSGSESKDSSSDDSDSSSSYNTRRGEEVLEHRRGQANKPKSK